MDDKDNRCNPRQEYRAACHQGKGCKYPTHILARPKSMILTLLVTLLTHRMFSGLNGDKKKNNKQGTQWMGFTF